VTNITFIFKTPPITKLKEKKVGGHGILCPTRLKKWGGHVPRIPQQIAPMAKVGPTLRLAGTVPVKTSVPVSRPG